MALAQVRSLLPSTGGDASRGAHLDPEQNDAPCVPLLQLLFDLRHDHTELGLDEWDPRRSQLRARNVLNRQRDGLSDVDEGFGSIHILAWRCGCGMTAGERVLLRCEDVVETDLEALVESKSPAR